MDSAIIVFPGSNREHDMAMALKAASGHDPRLVWHQETDLGKPDLIVLPGGFSYGDYLRCGAMAAHSPVMKEVIRLAHRGTRILGVCNGFQMLVETRLLPGALLHNKSLKFMCRRVNLRCENNRTEFTSRIKKNDILDVPIAHGEGNYFINDNQLRELEDNESIAFRYCDGSGNITDDANPNGSIAAIAGVFNKDKTILGMMPHPENATQDWQNSRGGANLFESIVEALA
jgi:phosphoribosylformylglycinamidine synthase subunit PurQ / glutaminase